MHRHCVLHGGALCERCHHRRRRCASRRHALPKRRAQQRRLPGGGVRHDWQPCVGASILRRRQRQPAARCRTAVLVGVVLVDRVDHLAGGVVNQPRLAGLKVKRHRRRLARKVHEPLATAAAAHAAAAVAAQHDGGVRAAGELERHIGIIVGRHGAARAAGPRQMRFKRAQRSRCRHHLGAQHEAQRVERVCAQHAQCATTLARLVAPRVRRQRAARIEPRQPADHVALGAHDYAQAPGVGPCAHASQAATVP